MADKKPRGWGKFDELSRKLAKVPKEEVEAKIAEAHAKRKKRKRRK